MTSLNHDSWENVLPPGMEKGEYSFHDYRQIGFLSKYKHQSFQVVFFILEIRMNPVQNERICFELGGVCGIPNDPMTPECSHQYVFNALIKYNSPHPNPNHDNVVYTFVYIRLLNIIETHKLIIFRSTLYLNVRTNHIRPFFVSFLFRKRKCSKYRYSDYYTTICLVGK